jgi:hypothetical protein
MNHAGPHDIKRISGAFLLLNQMQRCSSFPFYRQYDLPGKRAERTSCAVQSVLIWCSIWYSIGQRHPRLVDQLQVHPATSFFQFPGEEPDMSRLLSSAVLLSFTVCLAVGSAAAADKPAGLDKTGKPDLKSAGALAFGPDGILFVGDAQGAALFAIGVDPAPASKPAAELKLEGLDAKIAALLGTKAEDILINDLAVQPKSGIAYLSVSRGKGPDAEPVIVTVGPTGKLAVLPLDKVAYAKIALANAPGVDAKDQRGNSLRQDAITDLHYLDGRVFIAGLSNEAFDSTLRAIPFPFTGSDLGTSVEIYHGAHGKFETRAPVRTFVPFIIGGEPHLMAAYQCTPLVTFPIAQLKPGSKLRGTTVAELGNMNRPLDIISYQKDGHMFLLLANSRRGVMKISTENVEKQEGITQQIAGTAGLTYETIDGLKGVEHLDRLDNAHALLLVKNGTSLSLQSVPLP